MTIKLLSRDIVGMKLITVIIKPFELDDVRGDLSEIGVQHITVTEVKNFEHQKVHKEFYHGVEYVVDFLPKVKIELAIADDMADQVVETIMNTANTDQIGNDNIFIVNLEQAVRIRTEETGVEAV